jgi:pyruvate,water dikinase
VHVLQARPITRELRSAPARVRWSAANTQEALLDPVTPLTWSLLAPLVESGRRALFAGAGFQEIDDHEYMRLFYGVPYFNPEYFRRFLAQIPGAPENIFDALIFGEGEQVIEFHLPAFTRRTARVTALFVLARLAARERFEVFQRVFAIKLRALRRRGVEGLTDAELLSLRRDATDLLEGALRRHVLGTAISGCSYLLLGMLLERTGAAHALEGGLTQRLTSGASGNPLAQVSERLEELARRVEEGEEPSDDRLVRLLTESGFLREFGHRCEKEAELSEPRWADDPQVLVAVLRSYVQALRSGTGLTRLREREARLAAEASVLADRVSRFLARSSLAERLLPAKRTLFRALLREARRYAPYRESLKDRGLRALHLLRRVFLEAGTRLVSRGVLDRPDDVFFLLVADVETALPLPVADARRLGLRSTVAANRAERARNLGTEPPAHVLVAPGLPPQPVPPQTLGSLLEGVGVSSGRITGIARVLKSMDEAERLAPGEILIARVINAGWTPLFHLAGAIVADVGGVLSHGAIVAREYGLPAVFGAAGASQIPDGSRVTVDGNLGVVTVEQPPDRAR